LTPARIARRGLVPEVPVPAVAGLLLALVTVSGGAGFGAGFPTRPASGDVGERAEDGKERKIESLEHLEALGYAQWARAADPNKRGVTSHDPSRTAPGYNLFTNNADQAYLIDMDGARVHEWRWEPGKKCTYAELLPDGSVLLICGGDHVDLLDWSSKPIWRREIPAHHDIAVRADGTLLLPLRAERPYKGRSVLFDSLATVSGDGEVREIWSAFDRLEELRLLHPPSPLDTPTEKGGVKFGQHMEGFDYYHLNTIEILPETPLGRRDPRFRAGNLLICLRNANLVAVLDQENLSVVWHWGTETLDLPHMPTMLENGNILIFDNGWHRGHSRVLEVEPPSGLIVWRYEADPLKSFYSKARGSSQRLANGNTLICESDRGRVFEVTPDKEIVWEFWNPDLLPRLNKRKAMYRFMRYPPSMVEPLIRRSARSAGDPSSKSP
jgi:hypothetical protein